MNSIGFFSEMNLYENSGSVNDCLVERINYDKQKVVDYLKRNKKIASCPRSAIDCLTKEEIAPNFIVYTDGEYQWCDFLIYHVEKYNIKLPEVFLKKTFEGNT